MLVDHRRIHLVHPFYMVSYVFRGTAYVFACPFEKLLNEPGMSAQVLLGISHTHPDFPFCTDPNDPDTLHAPSTQHVYHPTGWTGATRQTEGHDLSTPQQNIYGVPGPSTLPKPSPTMIVGTSSSPSAKSHTQSRGRDDYRTLTRRCFDKWRTQHRAPWRHRHRVRPRGSQRRNRGIWKISALSAPKIGPISRRYVNYSKSRCSRDQTLSFAVSIYTFIIRSERLSVS